MNDIRPYALVVVGSPKSGLAALSGCLKILGLKSPGESGDLGGLNAASINRLLFQELGARPDMIGGLPDHWMMTPAAGKARSRIQNLVSQSVCDAFTGLIADSCLCRTLPLWISVYQELNIEPRFIVMARHPWESAMSLNRPDSSDLQKAHLLWVANTRDALKFTQGFTRYILTFDRLIADPVSEMIRAGNDLNLVYPKTIQTAYGELLNFVQPQLKHHHVGDAPAEDINRFSPVIRIYSNLCRFRAVKALPDGVTGSLDDRTGLLKPDTLAEDATLADGNGLTDVFFSAIGQYERMENSLNLEKQKFVGMPRAGNASFSVLHFPVHRGEDARETVFLQFGEWQKISVPAPCPECLTTRPLRFSPLNAHGTVSISAVNLIDRATGKPVWSVHQAKDYHCLSIRGSAVRLSDTDNLVILITGDDAVLEFPCLTQIPDCPMAVEIWIKASRSHGAVNSFLENQVIEDASFAMGTIHHLSCTGGTVIAKCLASMTHVVLLSEISPVRYLYKWFNPFDPLQHFQANYPELHYTDQANLQKIFMDRLSWIVKKCRETSHFLILRDHSHTDFLEATSSFKSVLYSFLSRFYTVNPVVTIRNPIDSYLALKSNKNFPSDVNNFDEYCKRILAFLDVHSFSPVFRYEDFVNDSDSVLKKMCDIYRIEFNPAYRDFFHEKQLTGDSGRGKSFKEIKKLERRPYDEAFWNEVLESPSFDLIAKKYDYSVGK